MIRSILGAALALALVTKPQLADHKARMDAAQDLSLDLGDAVDAADQSRVKAVYAQLQPLLAKEDSYWAAAQLTDIEALSQANRGQLDRLLDRAEAKDWKAAQTAMRDFQSGCRGCHDLHPEKRVNLAR